MPTDIPHCFDCSSDLDENIQHETVDGRAYCLACHDRLFMACHECGEVIDRNRDRDTTNPNDEPLCEDCFDELCITCGDCGCTVWEDDSHNGGSFDRLCYNCWDNEYNDEWSPETFAPPNNSFRRIGSRRCYGIELEYQDAPSGGRSESALQYFGCKDEHCGVEYFSSILQGDQGLIAAESLAEHAIENGWAINTDCGYHLHLDMRDESLDKLQILAYAYLKTYRVWARFVSDWRRNQCSFCAAPNDSPSYIRGMSMAQFTRWMRCSERYTFVNWNSYGIHTTVEVRLHHATRDGTAITNWVKAHARFVDWALEQTFESIDETFVDGNIGFNFAAIANIWNSPSLRTYYLQRAEACDSPIPTGSHVMTPT